MPRGTGLRQLLLRERASMVRNIETIDQTIRLLGGGKSHKGSGFGSGRRMSEAQKEKIRQSAKARWAAKGKAKQSKPKAAKPKAVRTLGMKERPKVQAEAVGA